MVYILSDIILDLVEFGLKIEKFSLKNEFVWVF